MLATNSSLLRTFVNYGSKKFYRIATRLKLIFAGLNFVVVVPPAAVGDIKLFFAVTDAAAKQRTVFVSFVLESIS